MTYPLAGPLRQQISCGASQDCRPPRRACYRHWQCQGRPENVNSPAPHVNYNFRPWWSRRGTWDWSTSRFGLSDVWPNQTRLVSTAHENPIARLINCLLVSLKWWIIQVSGPASGEWPTARSLKWWVTKEQVRENHGSKWGGLILVELAGTSSVHLPSNTVSWEFTTIHVFGMNLLTWQICIPSHWRTYYTNMVMHDPRQTTTTSTSFFASSAMLSPTEPTAYLICWIQRSHTRPLRNQ